MRDLTCKVENHEKIFKTVNDALHKKVFALLEGNGKVQDIKYLEVLLPHKPSKGQTQLRYLLEVVCRRGYSHTLWVKFLKPHDNLLSIEPFVIVLDRGGESLEFETDKHFQDFLNPTELELEQFELETGYPYILSSKFFLEASCSESFEVTLRTTT